MPTDEGRELAARMRDVRKTRQALTTSAAEKSYLERHAIATPQAKCSRTLYVVLGLFLGWLGVHNFVAGRTGRGVAQLVLLLATFATAGMAGIALAIWILVDIITVTTDGTGARMT